MFDNHVTRPQHFLIPAALILVGGLFARVDTWEYVGWGLWAVAAFTVHFLLSSAKRDHELKKIEHEQAHIAEMMKLDVAKTKTKVIIDKTDLTGAYHSQSYRDAPLDPARLKIFATGILNGRKLRIREWTPISEGKLMSDNEWRTLIEYLKRPDPDSKEIEFVTQRNPGVSNSVYDWTPAGEKWLKSLVDTTVYASVPQ